jgi:hypothetical protein
MGIASWGPAVTFDPSELLGPPPLKDREPKKDRGAPPDPKPERPSPVASQEPRIFPSLK